MRTLILVLLLCCVFGCDEKRFPVAVPTAPTPAPAVTPVPVPVPPPAVVSCPTDAPTGLRVGQTQGRTDITWNAVGAIRTYLVWIAEDRNTTPWPYIAGAPMTAMGTRLEWPGADPAGTYAVRVQSSCGGGRGLLSEPVVFGGRSGPIVEPPSPPPPPMPQCTNRKGC